MNPGQEDSSNEKVLQKMRAHEQAASGLIKFNSSVEIKKLQMEEITTLLNKPTSRTEPPAPLSFPCASLCVFPRVTPHF